MLKKFLAQNWKKFTKTDMPDTLQVVPVSSCLHDYGNDIVLIFINESSYPEYILKAGRNPAYSSKLVNEFQSLTILHNEKKLSSYVPKPYYIGSYNENTFFLQGGFKGIALSRLIQQKGADNNIKSLINQSIDLLAEISKTKYVKGPQMKSIIYETDKVYEILEKELTSEEHKEKIKALYKTIKNKDNNIFLHGDYWQTNIIVDYDKAKINGIIDWEFSHPEAAYPGDIVSFTINLGHCLLLHEKPGASIADAYKSVFFSNGSHSRLIATCYSRYLSDIGWDKNDLIALLELTLAEMSMRERLAYGKHSTMDQVWKELLVYTMENENMLCIL